MKQETLNLIANIDENTVILPKSEGGAFEMYQMDTIADLRKVSRNFMRTEKILESIDAKTSAASELVAGIVTEARIKEISKALDPIQATETVAGITKYGTKEQTALEGFWLCRQNGIPDDMFGGNINLIGEKMKGKVYYDKNTNSLFYCKEKNNFNYVNLDKFINISNLSLLDKLENLSEVKLYSIDNRLTVGLVYKIGKICILSLDSNSIFNGKNYGDVLFNVPVGYRPKYLTPAPVGFINSNISGAVHIETNGNVIWRGTNSAPTAMYINATYIVAD